MFRLNVFLTSIVLFESFYFDTVNACLATSSPATPIVSTEAPVLRRCLASDLPLGSGVPTTDREIDVTSSMYQTTQIPGTLDTTATMNLQCTAETGFFASMSINEGLEVAENVPPTQTVTIPVSCSSVDMVWQYMYPGVSTPVPLTRVWCQG